jgi:hypothetical protein
VFGELEITIAGKSIPFLAALLFAICEIPRSSKTNGRPSEAVTWKKLGNPSTNRFSESLFEGYRYTTPLLKVPDIEPPLFLDQTNEERWY